MNAFVRQIAVLSVLWAMCEMLLPDGKYQQMVRMTASLLVMSALLTTLGGWMEKEQPAQPAMTIKIQQAAQDIYHRTALTAMANQLESYCVRMAQRAGYQASAVVCLTMDGALDHVQMQVNQPDAALLPPGELAAVLADQLGAEEDRIWLSVEEQ